MDDYDSFEGQVSHRSGFFSKKLTLALIAFALVSIVAIAGSVYLAFNYIRTNVEATSLEIPLLSDEPVRNQIAFVGNDLNLWLVSPTGSNLRRLTLDGRGYRFPTWSPDGRQIAFIGKDETNQSALFVSPTNRSEPNILFNEPDAAPFYLYWAPDSQAITFLTQEASGLAMRMINTRDAEETSRILGEGSPFYWSWAPDSDKMVMHVGGSRATSDEAHISLLDNQQGAERVELKLDPGRFQAPVWSTDGKYFYYIAANEADGEAIYRTDSTTLAQEKVTDLGGFAHMVLSSDGKHIAYLQLEPGISPPFGRAYLVDTDGKNKRRLLKRAVASIYWSPDGKKLALLSLTKPKEGPTAKIDGLALPLSQELRLRWWVYDLETDELQPILSFEPTVNFLQTVPYFDQYHLSLSFWSPDSRYLVVTKRLNDKNTAGEVWVVDTTDQEKPLKVGDGSLAIWSWQ